MIARGLQASQYSELALRPIQAHPYYSEANFGPPISAETLLPEVVGLYKKYPYYDDVLEPFARTIRTLDPRGESKLDVNLALDRSGALTHFRQLPSLREPIYSAEELARLRGSELHDQVLARARSWDSADARCGRCRWRHVCGAMDRSSGAELFAPTCDAKQFLLEMLLWERVAVARSAAGEPNA